MASRSDKGKGKAVVYSGNTDSRGGAIFMGDQNAGRDINITTFTTIRPTARETYLKCLSSSELFQPLASELASLMTVLQIAEENAFQSQNSKVWDFRMKVTTSSQRSFGYDAELATIMSGCHAVLSEIQKLVQEYDNLSTQRQWTWERLEWEGGRISDLRARLVSNVSMLSALNTSIIMSSQAGVKQMLQKFINEIRSGQRVGSVLSRQMGKPLVFNNQEAWHQIRKELQDVGITSEVFNEHQNLIVSLIKQAVSGGGLEEFHKLSQLEPIEDEVTFPKLSVGQQWNQPSRKTNTDSELLRQVSLAEVSKVVRILKEDGDVNRPGENNDTALMRAISLLSRTPKFLDVDYALKILEPGPGEDSWERQESSKDEVFSISESRASDSEAESSEHSEHGETSPERFLRLFKMLLMSWNGEFTPSLVGAMIMIRSSWTSKPPKSCCYCRHRFFDDRVTKYQCKACGGYMDRKCKANFRMGLEDENCSLDPDVCHHCLINIAKMCNDDNSSETSDLIKLTGIVKLTDLPAGPLENGELRDALFAEPVPATAITNSFKDDSATQLQQNTEEEDFMRECEVPAVTEQALTDALNPRMPWHEPGPLQPIWTTRRRDNSPGGTPYFRKESPNVMIRFPQETQTNSVRTLSLAFALENKPKANLSSGKPFAPTNDDELWEALTSSREDNNENTLGVTAELEVPDWDSTYARIYQMSQKPTAKSVHSPWNPISTFVKWRLPLAQSRNTPARSTYKAPSRMQVRMQRIFGSDLYQPPTSSEQTKETKRNLLTIIKILLQAGADTETQTSYGYTALALAAQIPQRLESLIICQLLIQHGANVNAAGLQGTTILMRAAAKRQEHILALLLEHGVDVTTRDGNGHAAWHWATRFGRSERIEEMLREKGGCVERRELSGVEKMADGEGEEGNHARTMLPLLVDYVYSVEVPEKRHTVKEPDAAFWDEWLDMDKFS